MGGHGPHNPLLITHVLVACGGLFAKKGYWTRAVATLSSIPEDFKEQYEVPHSLEKFSQHLSAEQYTQAQAQGQQLTPVKVLGWVEAESAEMTD